jgi:hypothetical protein
MFNPDMWGLKKFSVKFMEAHASDAEELKRFLLAAAELADAAGEAPRWWSKSGTARATWRCGPAPRLRYLKPPGGEDVIAMTTMGRFAADLLG